MNPRDTPEYTAHKMDAFISLFEAFNVRLVARVDPDVYLPLSDKIALFAIYLSQKE